MPHSIVDTWLASIIKTADERDHQSHMDLISRKVNLVGVPGFESIGFDDWSNRCRHDFNDNIIAEIQYQGLKIRAETDQQIMFVTHETLLTNDGEKNQQGIECLLEKEDDGQWRLTQQRILGEDETAQYLK
ncbi:hypothetical protein MNBD_GAMMA21-2315 [hydrothermal vent metagenome]|uniref:SnoaL-like domain-containing protein n=1 Tax=hydrothermal vent metagenome TaxID=652676 RepID=A0A3B1B704_9ZZZZ